MSTGHRRMAWEWGIAVSHSLDCTASTLRTPTLLLSLPPSLVVSRRNVVARSPAPTSPAKWKRLQQTSSRMPKLPSSSASATGRGKFRGDCMTAMSLSPLSRHTQPRPARYFSTSRRFVLRIALFLRVGMHDLLFPSHPQARSLGSPSMRS